MKICSIRWPAQALLLLLTACAREAPEAPAPAPVALVELQPAARRGLGEHLTAYGTAEFSITDGLTLSTVIESQVAAVLVAMGAPVHRGQALVRLLPTAPSRLELDAASRAAVLTAAERERLKRLRAEGLATEAELQAAVDAASTAAELAASLAERIGATGSRILTAPQDGTVDELAVHPGDVLAAGAPVLRLAVGDSLQVKLGIEPEDLARVATGQTVLLSPINGSAAAVEARIQQLDRRVDPQTRLAAALVRLPPGSGGLPGAVMRGEILLARHEQALAVPSAALRYEAGATCLFVAVDGKAQRREVKPGLRDGDWVEVDGRLAPGESVVVAGTAVLEDGMAIRSETAAGNAAAQP